MQPVGTDTRAGDISGQCMRPVSVDIDCGQWLVGLLDSS